MPSLKFQTDAQKARFDKLGGELLYAQRVVKDIAEPLVEARDRIKAELRSAAAEIGMPDGVQQYVVKGDGVYFAGPGQVWDPAKGEFVDPPAPAKKAARKPAKRSRKR